MTRLGKFWTQEPEIAGLAVGCLISFAVLASGAALTIWWLS